MSEHWDPLAADILCFSSTDWEGTWGSRQQVMLRLARRGQRVLYIEQLAGLEHLLRYPELRQRKQRLHRQGLRLVADNLWAANPPILLPGRYYSAQANRLNTWLAARWAKKMVGQLGLQAPILWVYKPEHAGLVGVFGERLSVYHCIDEWTAGTQGRKRRLIASLEAQLLDRVNLVLANSPPTYEAKRRRHPRVFRIPSGVDIALFAQALEPGLPVHPAITNLPRPRLGYSGAINERLDYAILEHLAGSHPEWSLVLVGEPYPSPALRRLQTFPNVYFLGKFPPEQIPAVLKGMDACLIPYVNDERGYYRSPLKLYEYLAAGKPVASTPQPEVQEFAEQVPAEYIYLADTPAAFADGVAQALAQDNPDRARQRAQIAVQHSWERRVDQIQDILRQYGTQDFDPARAGH
ncbi:MAG: glycosyltransferase [Chloroflexota bacterium]